MKGRHGEGEGSARGLLIRTHDNPDALKSRHVSFPLTPALSPEEREQHSAPFGPFSAGCRSCALSAEAGDEGKNVNLGKTDEDGLPLPGGEGRGEGERSAQISTRSPLVTMLHGLLIRTRDNPDSLKSRDVCFPLTPARNHAVEKGVNHGCTRMDMDKNGIRTKSTDSPHCELSTECQPWGSASVIRVHPCASVASNESFRPEEREQHSAPFGPFGAGCENGLPCPGGLFLVFGIFVVSLAGLLPVTAAPAAAPNLLFILADDLRWDALGFMGNRVVQTPNLDRLARRGTIFRNAFVTTSICCVSRASIMAGQAERRHGIADFATAFKPGQWAKTYPALLRQGGYRTGFIGKFGVGTDAAIKAMAPEFDYWRGLPGQGGLFFATNDPTRTHATLRMGGQALEFLREVEPRKPFCLSISFNAPHARDGQPREFPPDLRDESLYADVQIKPPVTASEEFHRLLPEPVQNCEGRKRWERRFATPEMFQATVKDYYRLVTGLDREVGRILQLLEERGLATNTVVIFTSDNGFAFGDRGLADKWFLYEESIRVPLVIADLRGPARRQARTVEPMVLNIDLASTLLDYAGLPVPDTMQGRSLRGFVDKRRVRDWRTEWLYEHHFGPKIIPPSEGVRTECWKYIRYINESPAIEELFDLQQDRWERRNLAKETKFAGTLAQLRERWKALGEEWK
jgi:arylsulfatase A-like enzyme